MNPKSVNDLDPKLKEAYERIMGTSFTPNTPPGTSNQPPAQNAPVMQTTPVVDQPVTQAPTLQVPPAEPAKNPFDPAPEPPISVFTQAGPVSSPAPAGTQKKKMNILPILLVVGGLIFFVVYVIVWAKVFGLF